MSKRSVTDKPRQEARDAFERHAWQEAYDLFSAEAARIAAIAEGGEILSSQAPWRGTRSVTLYRSRAS